MNDEIYKYNIKNDIKKLFDGGLKVNDYIKLNNIIDVLFENKENMIDKNRENIIDENIENIKESKKKKISQMKIIDQINLLKEKIKFFYKINYNINLYYKY